MVFHSSITLLSVWLILIWFSRLRYSDTHFVDTESQKISIVVSVATTSVVEGNAAPSPSIQQLLMVVGVTPSHTLPVGDTLSHTFPVVTHSYSPHHNKHLFLVECLQEVCDVMIWEDHLFDQLLAIMPLERHNDSLIQRLYHACCVWQHIHGDVSVGWV